MKLLTAFLTFASTITFAADQPDTSGWKNLFAADLSNAVDASGWQFDGKELVAKNHDTIWTKESYGDFILDLEFKVAKESNSGVFLRTRTARRTSLRKLSKTSPAAAQSACKGFTVRHRLQCGIAT
jgi:hypothetical protein